MPLGRTTDFIAVLTTLLMPENCSMFVCILMHAIQQAELTNTIMSGKNGVATQLAYKNNALQHIARRIKKYVRGNVVHTEVDYARLLHTYQEFVATTLDRYLHDFDLMNTGYTCIQFYQRFWLTFFGELVTEANRVNEIHRLGRDLQATLQRDLQTIAVQGLSDFKTLFN